MEKVKLEIEVNLSDQDETKALIDFLTTIGLGNSKEEPKQKKLRTKTKKEEPAEAEEEPTGTEEETKMTAQDLRTLAISKGRGNKSVIKAKLKKLGAENITSLDKKHYEDFKEFLEGLEEEEEL